MVFFFKSLANNVFLTADKIQATVLHINESLAMPHDVQNSPPPPLSCSAVPSISPQPLPYQEPLATCLPPPPLLKKPTMSSETVITKLEQDISRMKDMFEDLVDSVEDSFQSNEVSLEKLKRKLKHIPMSLQLQLGEYFLRRASMISKAESCFLFWPTTGTI